MREEVIQLIVPVLFAAAAAADHSEAPGASKNLAELELWQPGRKPPVTPVNPQQRLFFILMHDVEVLLSSFDEKRLNSGRQMCNNSKKLF